MTDRTLAQIGRDVITEDGGAIYVTDKGEQFDCKRCWRVVTLQAPRFPTSKAQASPGSVHGLLAMTCDVIT